MSGNDSAAHDGCKLAKDKKLVTEEDFAGNVGKYIPGRKLKEMFPTIMAVCEKKSKKITLIVLW